MIKENWFVCSNLSEEDIKKIEFMTGTASILTQVLETDVFIDCLTKNKNKAIVVYHSKPNKNSVYSKNIEGELALSSNEPAVFRTFMTGLPSKNYKAVSQENKRVYQDVIPITNNENKVICVIIVEYTEDRNETYNSKLFNEIANRRIKDSRNTIPEFVRDGLIIFNESGLVIHGNKVANEIYGKLGVDIIVGESFRNMTLTNHNFQDILDNNNLENSIEVRILNMILLIEYFKTYDDKKKENVIMIVRDITKEKNYEQELILKSVVIKEMHHRVKNNLQAIISILRIQKRRTKNEEVIKILNDTIGRIVSISSIHEVLSENEIEILGIKRTIDIIYNKYFKNTIDKKLKIEFNNIKDDIFMDSERALTVILILNELIQNSITHAFKGKSKGKIDINMFENEHTFKVEMFDNGNGFNESLVGDSSIGLMLVKRLVSDKLNGEISIETSLNKGTKIEFEFSKN